MNKAISRNSRTLIFDKKMILWPPGCVFFCNPLDQKQIFFSRWPWRQYPKIKFSNSYCEIL